MTDSRLLWAGRATGGRLMHAVRGNWWEYPYRALCGYVPSYEWNSGPDGKGHKTLGTEPATAANVTCAKCRRRMMQEVTP